MALLQVGCGAGNTIFPVLELNSQLQIYGCDFSPRAIEIVKAHPGYASGRVHAFVADITKSADLLLEIPEGTVDFVTMVFVLSAISPSQMHAALCNIARLLKPGSGKVLFRDYARGDLAQDKHQSTGVKKIGENFYMRGDGTRCFYFEEQELKDMFLQYGLHCTHVVMHERDVNNMKQGITMHRRWIQAVFKLDGNILSPTKQPGNRHVHVMEEDHLLPTGSGWLVGAAGRLASNTRTSPGVPSGRAQLPLSLDSADEVAQSLSPGLRPMRDADMEELEKEFFEAVSRDAEEVVAEEAAVQGIAAIKLHDPFLCAQPSQLLPNPVSLAVHHSSIRTVSSGHQIHHQPETPTELLVSPGMSFLSQPLRDDPSYISDLEMELTLASLCVHSPQLLANRSVVVMEAGPSGTAAMAAVRSAGRVVSISSNRQSVEAVLKGIRLNSSRLVVERLRACQVAWGDQGHLQQALRQAPDPPGCYDTVLSAGLIERCIAHEQQTGVGKASLAEGAAKGSWREGSVRGGIREALCTARCLVCTNQGNQGLPSVTHNIGRSLSTDTCASTKLPLGQAVQGQFPLPLPHSFALLVEKRGVLQHAEQHFRMMSTCLRACGWATVSEPEVPLEIAAWLAGPNCPDGSWRGPVGEHYDVLILKPIL
ncbi:hypothetical protein CEUSTIGMA_g13635.t1 [Chlamydomonas eustigma]|uniref:Methyltransferase type 12 domain-containing protein n=1 Tax=Chlamydomonas eustigma TaxID=1157962 RepID=A0A250XTH7_9CHLO|nr:hypothetical protein CEUSTIGMA_g13635.t1 [Chlamydomonas eustigma]|eukprot:GAX86222.1 hypothetical protein CEUSTIGMA_g13635.t1 [Chlamydomonas eustigma]